MVVTKENNTAEKGLGNMKEKGCGIHIEKVTSGSRPERMELTTEIIKRKNNLGRKIRMHKCSDVETCQYV